MSKIVFLILISCMVLVASGCVDDLNPVESKQDNTHLKVGDVGIIDDLKIEVINVHQDFDGPTIAEGSGIISIGLRVENIGKFATGNVMKPYSSDSPTLYYYGRKMPYTICHIIAFNKWYGFVDKYPGVVEQGYVCFKVPSTIELDKTVLNTHGLNWTIE